MRKGSGSSENPEWEKRVFVWGRSRQWDNDPDGASSGKCLHFQIDTLPTLCFKERTYVKKVVKIPNP